MARAVAAERPSKTQPVFTFGKGKGVGDKSMKELLGGKGANLAEMCKIGLSGESPRLFFLSHPRTSLLRCVTARVRRGEAHLEAAASDTVVRPTHCNSTRLTVTAFPLINCSPPRPHHHH